MFQAPRPRKRGRLWWIVHWVSTAIIIGFMIDAHCQTHALPWPPDTWERSESCQSYRSDDAWLEELQSMQHHQHQQRLDELEHSFRRARRAARLPEVFRIQTGARFDRDRENRLRLQQDYDGSGQNTRSILEDRDTFQDDLYVDLRISADWRFTRTRWGDDEISLRRERSALLLQLQSERRELVRLWFGFLQRHAAFCRTWATIAASTASETDRTQAHDELYERTLSLREQLSLLSELLSGASGRSEL